MLSPGSCPLGFASLLFLAISNFTSPNIFASVHNLTSPQLDSSYSQAETSYCTKHYCHLLTALFISIHMLTHTPAQSRCKLAIHMHSIGIISRRRKAYQILLVFIRFNITRTTQQKISLAITIITASAQFAPPWNHHWPTVITGDHRNLNCLPSSTQLYPASHKGAVKTAISSDQHTTQRPSRGILAVVRPSQGNKQQPSRLICVGRGW
jgi:hypothetical protein